MPITKINQETKMTEHKHAKVLRAIAEGFDVEWKYPTGGNWYRWNGVNPKGIDPLNSPGYGWRIAAPKWQEELRQAAREGKELEFLYEDGEWGPSLINEYPDTFDFLPEAPESRYRIRPAPKPDVTIYGRVNRNHPASTSFFSESDWSEHGFHSPNMMLTFSGETDELIRVELIVRKPRTGEKI